MVLSTVGVLLLAAANSGSAHLTLTAPFQDPQHPLSSEALAQVEADASRAMQSDTLPFAERAELVARVQAARDSAPEGEPSARMALLWLRAVKWMLAGIPIAQRDGQPHGAWIDSHVELVTYSEPAGQWLIVPDIIWQIHDQHRRSSVADEIAWLAVTNGLPGECEGYVPCDAHGLNTLDGEYLRRHPRGTHVAEAVERTKSSLEQSLELLSGPDGRRFFDASHDCPDLKPPLSAVRDALAGTLVHPLRDETLTLAGRLLAMCP